MNRSCTECKKTIWNAHPSQLYCKTCWGIVSKRNRKTYTEQFNGIKITRSKKETKPARVLITDEEQRKINLKVDALDHMPFDEPRIFKPGDPGFNEIAATITPIERIRPAERPFMTLDNFDCYALYGRHESVNELR